MIHDNSCIFATSKYAAKLEELIKVRLHLIYTSPDIPLYNYLFTNNDLSNQCYNKTSISTDNINVPLLE